MSNKAEILKLLEEGPRSEFTCREGYDFLVDLQVFYEDRKNRVLHVSASASQWGRSGGTGASWFDNIPESECKINE